MADLDKGFTRIANEILESLASCDLSGRELRLLMIIMRYTYGFQRKKAELSLSFLSKATGIRPEHISKSLKKLSDRNIINICPASGLSPQQISLNKGCSKWQGLPKTAIAKNGNRLLPNTAMQELPKTATKKENIKEKNKEIYFCAPDGAREKKFPLFERLWEEYPNKRNKYKVKDAQRRKIESVGYEDMHKAIENCINNKPYYQTDLINGDKFFNGGYEDYLDEEKTIIEEKKVSKKKWQ